MSARLEPSDALLLGLGAMAPRVDGSSGHPGPSRDNWILRVLVEQLVRLAPMGRLADAARQMVDPQRGVTNRSVSRPLNALIDEKLITASAAGGQQYWNLGADAQGKMAHLNELLSRAERSAIRNAAHEAHARAVAWSKTARASGEFSCATKISS
jgi:hypothetical protein